MLDQCFPPMHWCVLVRSTAVAIKVSSSVFSEGKYMTLHESEVRHHSVAALGAVQRMEQCWNCSQVRRQCWDHYGRVPETSVQIPQMAWGKDSATFSFTQGTLSDDSSLQRLLHPAMVQAVKSSYRPPPTNLGNTDHYTEQVLARKLPITHNYSNTNLLVAAPTLALKPAVLIRTAFSKSNMFFPTVSPLFLDRSTKESRIHTVWGHHQLWPTTSNPFLRNKKVLQSSSYSEHIPDTSYRSLSTQLPWWSLQIHSESLFSLVLLGNHLGEWAFTGGNSLWMQFRQNYICAVLPDV